MNTGTARAELLAACLLTIAGGSMDACSFVSHGHVFATAQSGNVVLLALALASGTARQSFRHLPSIIAFLAGVIYVKLAEARPSPGNPSTGSPSTGSPSKGSPSKGSPSKGSPETGAPRRHCLRLECAGLVALALATRGLPDIVVTTSISFVAALQLASFSRIGKWSFSSAMTTSNLRIAASAATAVWLDPADAEARHRAIALSLVCLSFFAGALLGGYSALRLGDYTLFATAALVAAATFVLHRRQPSQEPLA
jgi:uncharacterized membrane protein YoaK (UPF0700 family)